MKLPSNHVVPSRAQVISRLELQIAAEFSVVENNNEIINEQNAHRDGDLITTPPLAAAVQAELKSATLLAIQTAAKASQNAAATAAAAAAKANRPPQIVVHLRQQQQQQQPQQQQQQHNLQQQLPQTDGIDSSNQSVQVISDIDYLTFLLNNHSPAITDYVIKLGGQGTIRILPKTSDVYRHIINVLKLDNTFRYNTYQLREDRSFRVVVRGLHSSTPPQRIRNELTELGYTVRNVFNPTYKNRNGNASSVSKLDPRSRLEHINKLQQEQLNRQLLQPGVPLNREQIVKLQQQKLDALNQNAAHPQRQQQQQQFHQQQHFANNQMDVDVAVDQQQQQQQQQQNNQQHSKPVANDQNSHIALLTELLIKQQNRSEEMMGQIAIMQQQIAGVLRISNE
ncbi:hypothetical protein ACLKA7_017647 [Drosophila subpalustris]